MGGDKHPKANGKFLRKINRFSFRFIEGKINFHSKPNSVYKDDKILKSLTFISIRNKYPENGCKRYGEVIKDNAPDADTLYRRIKQKEMEEFIDEFMKIQERIINDAKKKIRNKKITVFIDEHEIPWFGEPNQYVVGTNKFHGTKFAFKYITINAVISEQRICIYALPVTPFSSKHELVDKLLNIAKQFFRIGLILFDRGLSKDSKVLKTVEKQGLKYLAPMEKTERIKRIANTGDGVNPFYHTDYEFGKERVKTNLFFIPNEKYEKDIWKNYHVFCTNIDVKKANIEHLAYLYGKRWNIENFYRDAESNFMVKTKTADFSTRYFFFLFMSILYNLWYFIRGFHPVIAERWKDIIEDEMRKENESEKLLEDYLVYYMVIKNLITLFIPSYMSIFRLSFYREGRFFTISN